eukprot:162817_1
MNMHLTMVIMIRMNLAVFMTCNYDCPSTITCTDSDPDCTLICEDCWQYTYNCEGTNNVCEVQCASDWSCDQLTVNSNGDTSIDCLGSNACNSAEIYVTGTGNDVTANVTCSGQDACEEAKIELLGSSLNNELNLYCDASDSSSYPSCGNMNMYCRAPNTQCEVECATTDSKSCKMTANNNRLHCQNGGIGTECNIIDYGTVGFYYGATPQPSKAPNSAPSDAPSQSPSKAPSSSPSSPPTRAPSFTPSQPPTTSPSSSPTTPPSRLPSNAPSISPTQPPSNTPSFPPTSAPSNAPSTNPTNSPSNAPSKSPSRAPSVTPTAPPSVSPTQPPSNAPSQPPTHAPSNAPTSAPSFAPTSSPSIAPSQPPTNAPSFSPSMTPTLSPSSSPSNPPTNNPSSAPSIAPSQPPTHAPSSSPSTPPSGVPSNAPSLTPTQPPTNAPSFSPSQSPTYAPSNAPSTNPTNNPSNAPSKSPSHVPSSTPTAPPSASPTQPPSTAPTLTPSRFPTSSPSIAPSQAPTNAPSFSPSMAPTLSPSSSPSNPPTNNPSSAPSIAPSQPPTHAPSSSPSTPPSGVPSNAPSLTPTQPPTNAPSFSPSQSPTYAPSNAPSTNPTNNPSNAPSKSPSHVPSSTPTAPPSASPTQPPSTAPTLTPSRFPTSSPSIAPSQAPTNAPSFSPSMAPTHYPSQSPTNVPSIAPSQPPTHAPSFNPSMSPSSAPSAHPTHNPTNNPTQYPSDAPSVSPSAAPSLSPSATPTSAPTQTKHPTSIPSVTPSHVPSNAPSVAPSRSPVQPPTNAPTQYPTDAPSTPPTNVPSFSPSITPTNNPSRVPSIVPTISPSDAPSLNPSLSPFVPPTTAPSNNPTVAPSISPSAPVPSAHPSIAPTMVTIHPTTSPSSATPIPTHFPSQTPTISPTTCHYYNASDSLHDIDSASTGFSNIFSFNESALSTQSHRQTIFCNETDIHLCFIACFDGFSCEETNVIPIPNPRLRALKWVCVNERSCSKAVLNITHKGIEHAIENVTIICAAERSCMDLTIGIKAMYPTQLILHCNKSMSCANVVMHLEISEMYTHSMPLIVQIFCYMYDSCDSLHVDSDHEHSTDIDLRIALHEHSGNIVIHHSDFSEKNLECGSLEDHKFIEYDTTMLPNDAQLLDLAVKAYGTNKLPCSDVKIQCNEDESISCLMEYNVKPINLPQILQERAYVSCYWLDLHHFLTTTCVGNCDQEIIYYPHDVIFDMDIYLEIDEEEEYRQDVVQELCAKYFNNTNDTTETLHAIDAIFSYILKNITSHNSHLRMNIVQLPMTALRNTIICQDHEENTMDPLPLNTTFIIESISSNENQVQKLFNDGSAFMIQSQELISQFFGYSVLIIRNDEHNPPRSRLYVHYIGAGVTAIAVVLFIILFCYCHHVKNAAEKMAMDVYNPMVVMYAIGTYTPHPDDNDLKNIGGALGPLPLQVDIDNITRFCDAFGYKLREYKEKKEDALQWNEDEITNDLQFQSECLANNITKYDGLLVFVSCHGMEGGIITSDYKLIEKSFFHRSFSAKYPLSRKIPRVFIFDCCSGNEERVPRASISLNEPMQRKSGVHKELKEKTVMQYIGAKEKQLWQGNEDNPDFQLVQVDAANRGFQSKLNVSKGSYLITRFIDKSLEEKKENGKQFLYEIMDEIQQKLHQDGTQQIMPQYQNKTRYVRFRETQMTGGSGVMEKVASREEDHEDDGKVKLEVHSKGGPASRVARDARNRSAIDRENEIYKFLENIGMNMYYMKFKRHEFKTTKTLMTITDDVLRLDLKIKNKSHRITILNAICDENASHKVNEIISPIEFEPDRLMPQRTQSISGEREQALFFEVHE